MKEGVILFAHGSRDPEWARPFEAISTSLARRLPNAVVGIAYLEAMRPALPEAVAALASAGVRAIRVVPLFFGQGGHVKEDLPRLVDTLQKAHPDLRIALARPIGEDPAVIDAIAAVIARAVD